MPKLEPETNTSDWMARMPDDIMLSHMTIPGTHDSATFARMSGVAQQIFSQPFYQCQSKDFRSQLYDGIRFFELRGFPGHFGDGRPRIGFCHGNIGNSHFDLWFDDAFNTFRDFLREHPRETIIVTAKCDDGKGSEFIAAWEDQYGVRGKMDYPWY